MRTVAQSVAEQGPLKFGIEIDAAGELIQLSFQRRLDIHPSVFILPFGAIESVFLAVLSTKLAKVGLLPQENGSAVTGNAIPSPRTGTSTEATPITGKE